MRRSLVKRQKLALLRVNSVICSLSVVGVVSVVSMVEDVGVGVVSLLLSGGGHLSWDDFLHLLVDSVLNGVVDGLGDLTWLLVGDLSGNLVRDLDLNFVSLLLSNSLGAVVGFSSGDGVWLLVGNPFVDGVLNFSLLFVGFLEWLLDDFSVWDLHGDLVLFLLDVRNLDSDGVLFLDGVWLLDDVLFLGGVFLFSGVLFFGLVGLLDLVLLG